MAILKEYEAALDEKDAGAFLGLSRRMMQKMRFERRGPAYYKLEKAVRYRKKDLEAYMNKHHVIPEA